MTGFTLKLIETLAFFLDLDFLSFFLDFFDFESVEKASFSEDELTIDCYNLNQSIIKAKNQLRLDLLRCRI